MRRTIILINILGLTMLQLIETWRPGAVDAVISLAWCWVFAVGVCGLAWWLDQDRRQVQTDQRPSAKK